MNTVIYTIIKQDSEQLQVLYPPLYIEECDYICFTDNKNITSTFYKVIYIDNIQDNIDSYLREYKSKIYIEPNEIIIGSLIQSRSNTFSVASLDKYIDKSYSNTTKKTCDAFGNYIYTPNPVITDGKYEGRPYLVTIAMPVSNQISTINRCLASVKPILDALDAELLIADTGSTDGTIEVCKKYNARIIEFPWINDMSSARNKLINNARGLWYLSLDDDEWFESCDKIINFFQSGVYQNYNCASYIQHNYLLSDMSIFSDDTALRIAKITPTLHFEGRIHDALIVYNTKCLPLDSYVNHFGFAIDSEQPREKKFTRNVSLLYYDLLEYPDNPRFYTQMLREFLAMDYREVALSLAISGISITKEPNVMQLFSKHLNLHLATILNDLDNRDYLKTCDYIIKKYDYSPIERSFLLFNAVVHAYHHNKSYDCIHRLAILFEEAKRLVLADPFRASARASITTNVCSNTADMSLYNAIMYIAEDTQGNTTQALQHIKNLLFDCLTHNEKYDVATSVVKHAFINPEYAKFLFVRELSRDSLSTILNVYCDGEYNIDTSLFTKIKNNTYRYLFLLEANIQPDYQLTIQPDDVVSHKTITDITKIMLKKNISITSLIDMIPLSSLSYICDTLLEDDKYREQLISCITDTAASKNIRLHYVAMRIYEYQFNNARESASDYLSRFDSYMASCLSYAELTFNESLFTLEGPPLLADRYICAYRYMYATICIQEGNLSMAKQILSHMEIYFPMFKHIFTQLLL